jgi:RNA polymerase sigma factor (sigma-70 family)
MGDDRRQEAGRDTVLPKAMGEEVAADPSTAACATHCDRRARFRAVYDAHYHRVLGYVLRRTATREDAEDIVAETFLTAWRRLENVPTGSGGLLWLYGIARNTLANHRRGERRRGRLAGRLHKELGEQLSRPVDSGAEVALVAAAFARLRDDDRELLALAAWEGLDPGEIATVLGCSRNAARIRLHRARRRFARELRSKEVDAVNSTAVGTEAMREEGAR